MGISTGLQAIHNDDLHTGNAKRGVASGLATLDASSKVVQEPASKAVASGLATLDASSKVVQEPASKGLASGIAGLDAGSKIAVSNLPVNVASGIAGLDAGSKIAVSNLPVNVASGIAGLDASSRVPAAQLALSELIANKNAASGYAGLDASGRIAQANSFLAAPSLSIAKAKDTEYQNGSRPRLVVITVTLNIGATITSVSSAVLGAKSTAGVTAGDNASAATLNGYGVSLTASMVIVANITKVIPANYYYKLLSNNSGTGSITVNGWDETDL